MREILFEGRTKKEKQIIYGNLLKTDRGLYIIQNYVPFHEIGKYEVDPKTVRQYTGYKDMKKKKVFEYDIVLCDNNNYIGYVVFKEGQFMIEWKGNSSFRKDVHYWFTERRMFVVGNMFDNPEIYEKG